MRNVINTFFSIQFQESASPAVSSSVASSAAAGDFLQQRSSAKRKLDDDASLIGGGNGAGAISLDGKGDVKKVGAYVLPVP